MRSTEIGATVGSFASSCFGENMPTDVALSARHTRSGWASFAVIERSYCVSFASFRRCGALRR